ncbi:MAG: Multiple stress resistance protein BhsA [Candidatus Erwinia impunctatus]|nr:Multiple stress resistance protein BhsA [Culicoides impunctatus]
MKLLLISTLLLSFISVSSVSAAQLVDEAHGKNKLGVVSADNAYTLDELSNELSRKADEQGATSFKILSTTGNDLLHGVEEIYR